MIQKKALSVLFVVQAGKKHGIGHLKRALRIAGYYTSPFIFTISDLKDSSSLRPLFEDLLNYQIVHTNDKMHIADIFKDQQFDLIVCDCAHLPNTTINLLSTCPIPMISLDNATVGLCSEVHIAPLPSYKTKQANFTDLYYSPIDERFFTESTDPYLIQKILISLGGSDPNNNAEQIVKALKDSPYQITIIAGPLSKYTIEESENIRIVHQVTDLFPYITKTDLVFCGPGSTLLESLVAKKYVIVVAHTPSQYKDLSSLSQVYSLLGNMFLSPKQVKLAIEKSTISKFQIPEDFHFREWFLQLSDAIAGKPAFCPLCGSFEKRSFYRNPTTDQFSCNNCSSIYMYHITSESSLEDIDSIIANNSEHIQKSYKQAVLSLREDSNRRIQIIKKILPTPSYYSPHKLIDIGAEHGVFVQEASHNGFSAQGVELSSFARRVALDNHNIAIIDSMDKVYENGSVQNVITVWKKLEFLENPLDYLKRLSTLIPIGGLVAFRLPVNLPKKPLLKGYFHTTEKGGKLLAEQAGLVTMQTARHINEQQEESIEFYCMKKSEV